MHTSLPKHYSRSKLLNLTGFFSSVGGIAMPAGAELILWECLVVKCGA